MGNHLTNREQSVMALLVQGRSNKEAGQILSISPRTIEVHRARVYEKLGANNLADLALIHYGLNRPVTDPSVRQLLVDLLSSIGRLQEMAAKVESQVRAAILDVQQL